MSQTDAPMRFPWPPVLFAACLGVILLTPAAITPAPWLRTLAAILACAGALMIAAALWAMARAGTAIRPDRGANTLLTAGIFGKSRNPIYEGEACILASLCLALPSLPALLAFVGFLAGIQFLIRREEAHLARRFGDAFAAYRALVPRFLVSTIWFRER